MKMMIMIPGGVELYQKRAENDFKTLKNWFDSNLPPYLPYILEKLYMAFTCNKNSNKILGSIKIDVTLRLNSINIIFRNNY